MKVYIVTVGYDYEGSTNKYVTLDKSKACEIQNQLKEDVRRFDNVDIEEHTLDEFIE